MTNELKLIISIYYTSWLKRPKAVLISSDHVASPHMTLAAPMINSPNLSSKNLVYVFWPKFFYILTETFFLRFFIYFYDLDQTFVFFFFTFLTKLIFLTLTYFFFLKFLTKLFFRLLTNFFFYVFDETFFIYVFDETSFFFTFLSKLLFIWRKFIWRTSR